MGMNIDRRILLEKGNSMCPLFRRHFKPMGGGAGRARSQ